jgi:hypothetical protein
MLVTVGVGVSVGDPGRGRLCECVGDAGMIPKPDTKTMNSVKLSLIRI